MTAGGHKSPSDRDLSMDLTMASADDKRASVTIGVNPTSNFSSINGDESVMKSEEIPNERIAIANEYRNAREALKATG